MAFLSGQTWYVGSTKYSSVAQWAALTARAAGVVVRQLATPTFGSERVFACIIAGVSLASEPTWVTTVGAKTAESAGPTWIDVTGRAGVNGDTTNASAWLAVKNTSVSQGVIIFDSVTSSIQVCTTSGTSGNGTAPSFSATAGVTTTDNTATWTSLGLASNFGAYAAPCANLSMLMTSNSWVQNTDTIYVSNNHAETNSSAMSYGQPGLINLSIICVTDTAVPPVATNTTGSLTTTGASAIQIGTVNGGYLLVKGLVFNVGTGSSTANFSNGTFGSTQMEDCVINLVNTSTSSSIQGTSGSGGLNRHQNCTYTFANASQSLNFNPVFNLVGCTAAATGTVPTTLFSNIGTLTARDCDFSGATGALLTGATTAIFENCKLGVGVTFPPGNSSSDSGGTVRFINCDNANTNYRYTYAAINGTVATETSIIRSGGASDGTTPFSWKGISLSGSLFQSPLVSEWIATWNDVTGSSKTATLEFTTNSTLTNKDLYIEIEYLGDASSSKGSFATSRVSPIVVAPTTLSASSVTWAGTAQTNKYTVSVAFTPQKKGIVKARFYLTKPSVTLYADPFVTIV